MSNHIINQFRKENFKKVFTDNKLRLAITNMCNLSCFYCHNEGQPHYKESKFMSLNYVKELIAWLLDNEIYVESINLTGGEPLLHPDLIEIIDECKKITDEVRINTNGVLLTEQLIDAFCEHGVFALKIGIDSLYTDQTKPNLITTQTNIPHVLKMINYANKYMRVVLNTVVTKYNYQKIDNMIKFAMDTDIPRMKIIRLNDLDPRHLNNKDISSDFKTNQQEGQFFFDIYNKYISKALRYEHHTHKGRTDVFISSTKNKEFEIRFCDDVCISGACASMFTEISADENLIICPRYYLTTKFNDFNQDFNILESIIQESQKTMCDSKCNRYTIRDNKGGIEYERIIPIKR